MAATAAFLLLAVGSATSADTFELRLITQTSSTITLGWDPQAGFGYLFSVNGAVVSRTNDSSKSSVKFSKVANGSYEVAVIVKGATGTYPPPPPPPPPPTASVSQTIVNGSTVQNITGWRAVYDANGDGAEDDPGIVEFYIDGSLVLTESNAPFGDTFATGSPSASDGQHTFLVRALSDAGAVLATNSVTATVQASQPPPPPPPPPAGSYPDASNTGVPSGTTLTAYTGPATITTANTVIDSKTIGCITVSAPGVVIKNSRISCNGFIVVRGGGTSAAPLVIQDTDMDCQGANGTGIDVTNATVLRVDVSGCENGFNVGGPIDVEDSYIHDLVTANGAHTDGMQFNQGAGGITVRHNTINPTSASSGATSCIIMWDEGDPQNSNVLIENNRLLGGGTAYPIYTPRQGPLSNVRVINNRFVPGVYGGYNGGNGTLLTDRSGNVNDITGQPVDIG